MANKIQIGDSEESFDDADQARSALAEDMLTRADQLMDSRKHRDRAARSELILAAEDTLLSTPVTEFDKTIGGVRYQLSITREYGMGVS